MALVPIDLVPANIDSRQLANSIRALAMDAVQAANSGHPGMPMGAADMATILFTRFLKYDATDPAWPDRDRFVLSAGHGSMLLYALLYLTGYQDMDLEELRGFRQLGRRTAGHPEYDLAEGIETTTGPLGQGLATAVGMAIAERSLNARFGDDLVNHRTWVIASDGDLMEGISHESVSLAGHLCLDRLNVLYDDNGISIDGKTGLSFSDDTALRFEACGWDVLKCDGHDHEDLASAMEAAQQSTRPALVLCRTVIGYGSPAKAGTADAHGAPLGDGEITAARQELGWSHPPFHVPADVLASWREAGRRGASEHRSWKGRLAASEIRETFARASSGELPDAWEKSVHAIKQRFVDEAPAMATRASSGKVLDELVPAIPELIGGSADLSGSNNTRAASSVPLTASDRGGRYIHYGVREHAMAAAMNGMSLHGGVIPYGGTFLIFSDYLRPSLRLSALMGQGVIYVLTHDSIGLGEDGPTHQPVEHLASLRAMPNLRVFRPADAVEVAECWQLALAARDRPSVLALTRQAVPTLRTHHGESNRCREGAYVLAESDGKRLATLLATGSEVSLAMTARSQLQDIGIPTAVVSMPCWELFEQQDEEARAAVIGVDTVRVGVEAAVRSGWDRWIGPAGDFVGMQGFGASAPASALYNHFGITSETIVAAVRRRLGN